MYSSASDWPKCSATPQPTISDRGLSWSACGFSATRRGISLWGMSAWGGGGDWYGLRGRRNRDIQKKLWRRTSGSPPFVFKFSKLPVGQTWRFRSLLEHNQPGLAGHRFGTGNAEARRFEIRPRLLRAVLANGADVEAVAFCHGNRN